MGRGRGAPGHPPPAAAARPSSPPLARVRRGAGRWASATAAREIAVLARHGFGPGALLATAGVAFVAGYGRVPGLAAGVLLVWLAPLANALGPDVPMGGTTRHHLLPLGVRVVRDRRLAAWGAAAVGAVLAGTTLALALPPPDGATHPAGGALAAPSLALYAAAVLPHAGRAQWWFAARYAQPVRARYAAAATLGARAGHAAPAAPFRAQLALLVRAQLALLAATVGAAAALVPGGAGPAGAGVAWYAGVALAAGAAVALFALTRARP
ncbi:hypothetical protein tb265_11910 [Gemmatimonadetes bacterium T265]|nr:hypothetical protein tb265_11910 [Gemmatimonadetes bacterium T265]